MLLLCQQIVFSSKQSLFSCGRVGLCGAPPRAEYSSSRPGLLCLVLSFVKAEFTMDVTLLLVVCSVTTVIDAAGKPYTMNWSYLSLWDIVTLSSAPIACPGDTVSFTCTSTTGALAWRSNGETKLYNVLSVDVTATLGIFRLTADRQGSSTIVSMATVESVTSDNNGATITCNDDIVSNAGSLSAVVRVTGKSVGM